MPVMMTASEVSGFLDTEFPEIHRNGRMFEVEKITDMGCVTRLKFHPDSLRPGGTISGPSIMTLVDLSLYVAILGNIGPKALAVTTNLSFDFLRKPEPRDLIANCHLLKTGKRLIIGRVDIMSDGSEDLCAHAVGTYSVPPPSNKLR